MKRISIVLCVLLAACYNEPQEAWTPPIIKENVECCITDQQVHGAIYSALLKLRWHVQDKTDNGFVATIECDYDIDTEILFTNTDRNYVISVGNSTGGMYYQGDALYQRCVKSHMNKVNKYIKKYLKKAVRKAADKELSGIK